MKQRSSGEALHRVQDRLEGDDEYLKAESSMGNLKVTEKEAQIDLVWETESPFEEVLRPIERNYRPRTGIQVLDKDYATGDLSFSKARRYVTEGPLEDPFGDGDKELLDWGEYHLVQVAGEDFHVTWDQKGENKDYRVRVTISGSGIRPFRKVYDETVDDEGSEKVIQEVRKKFFDSPRDFPGYWNPKDYYD